MIQTLSPGRLDTLAVADTRLQVCVTPGPRGTAHVTVSGEIDLHDAAGLRGALRVALTTYRGAITVDLAGVTFCDCSGLNALLHARQDALLAGRNLCLTAVSHPAGRLLRLTGTGRFLTARADPAP